MIVKTYDSKKGKKKSNKTVKESKSLYLIDKEMERGIYKISLTLTKIEKFGLINYSLFDKNSEITSLKGNGLYLSFLFSLFIFLFIMKINKYKLNKESVLIMRRYVIRMDMNLSMMYLLLLMIYY